MANSTAKSGAELSTAVAAAAPILSIPLNATKRNSPGTMRPDAAKIRLAPAHNSERS